MWDFWACEGAISSVVSWTLIRTLGLKRYKPELEVLVSKNDYGLIGIVWNGNYKPVWIGHIYEI